MSEAPELHELSREETVRLILDFIHRAVMHHAMWYAEVRHQLGRPAADEVLSAVLERGAGIQMDRLARTLGFEMEHDLPKPLLELPDDTLQALKEKLAANWLANDGIWFQAVEFSRSMAHARVCNDACWAQFSPFEAWSIRRLLKLPENPGLPGLKQALAFRLYSVINVQTIGEETPDSFVFRMNECRVQSARKRKGLNDYPCKSGGTIEYASFAEAIDARIHTECIGCPPDPHPDEWYCAWRFRL